MHLGQRIPRRVALRVLLFSLPILAALLPQAWAFLLIPRDRIHEYIGAIDMASSKNHRTIAALYLYTSAAAVTIVACLSSCFYSLKSLHWLTQEGKRSLLREVLLLTAVAFSVAFLCFIVDGAIDDTTARQIFIRSGLAPDPKTGVGHPLGQPIAFGIDGRILGFATYLAFALAAVTCAFAATTGPGVPAAPPPERPEDGPASQRMAIVRMTLFLATAVLLAALVTAKFRFDVSLAAVGPQDVDVKSTYGILKSLVDAITTYWSVVLSLALAALYVPPAMALYPRYWWEKGADPQQIKLLSLEDEGMARMLRLAAIISPPIINQVITALTGEAK